VNEEAREKKRERRSGREEAEEKNRLPFDRQSPPFAKTTREGWGTLKHWGLQR